MMALVIVIHVIACVTLIAVILLQAGRGHGLAGGSFGGEMNTVFGTKTAKFMTKITSVCAILFLVTCLTIDVIISRSGRSLLEDDIAKGLTQEQINEMMTKIQDLKDKQEDLTDEAVAVSEDANAVTDEAQAVIDKAIDEGAGDVDEAASVVETEAPVVDVAAALQNKMEEVVATTEKAVDEASDTAKEEIAS